MLNCCVLLGLYWAKPMMLLLLHVTCSYIFHAYIPFLFLSYWYKTVWCFSACLSLSLSLFLLLVCFMTPKRKSTPSRNPLHSKAPSSSSPSNPTPSYIRFHDDKARKDFLENFSRRGIHSEHQVVLSNFFDTDLPTVIYSQGWESLCGIPVTCPSMIIQEFYSNMHRFDYSVPHFITYVQGTRIVVTLDIVSEVLHVPRVAHLDYPSYDHLRLCPKTNSRLYFVRNLHLGVTIKTPLARALQKVWGSLTWWWHSFSILCLNITLSQSLVLDFCYPSLRASLLIFPLISFFPS